MNSLKYKNGHKTLEELIGLFERRKLNLSPGFQRKPVWGPANRKELIRSIFQGFPIPSIFLYRRIENGEIIYDVLDGKQRIETLLMYTGRLRGYRFAAPIPIGPEGNDEFEKLEWRDVQRKNLGHYLMGYEIQVVEVEGDIASIRDLFVSINSTGKQLTRQEIRQAKYHLSPFLKEAKALAKKHEKYFNAILTPGQVRRMKHEELVCELFISVYEGKTIHKKAAIDKVLSGQSANLSSLNRSRREVSSLLKKMEKMFPRLNEIRFSKPVDFYSLFMCLSELSKQGCVLDDKKRNEQAQELLIRLATGVDVVSELIRKGKGIDGSQELFRDYLFTVRESTDTFDNRKRRSEILKSLLSGLFEKKDEKRNFSLVQRRLIWHSDIEKKCAQCVKPLSWANFTLDHVVAHSRGGRTDLSNAALMCGSCNSSKGNRSKARSISR